jgi:hypothetical protein
VLPSRSHSAFAFGVRGWEPFSSRSGFGDEGVGLGVQSCYEVGDDWSGLEGVWISYEKITKQKILEIIFATRIL